MAVVRSGVAGQDGPSCGHTANYSDFCSLLIESEGLRVEISDKSRDRGFGGVQAFRRSFPERDFARRVVIF